MAVTADALPPGHLAAVVTYLEMTDRPANPALPDSLLSLGRIDTPDPDSYRKLFRRVGARWLWFSRLVMDDERLRAIIHNPNVEIYAVDHPQVAQAGMLELDFRKSGECELAFLGLVPELAGQGHGKWLLGQALLLGWREGVRRLTVHTCTLDHPAALPAYLRAGFAPFKRAIERFPDPRLLGVLPPDCAPQLPVVGTLTSPASCA